MRTGMTAGTGTTQDRAQAQREVITVGTSHDWTNLLSGLMAFALVLSVMLGFLILIAAPAWAQSAVLLPNGRQQFLDANGAPLAGGQVFMYVAPATTTPKTTWQDAARVTPNTNPVTLDSSGEALIYGVGTYRQLVKDAIGNVIWDAQTNGLGGNTYAGVSTGSANAQVLATNDFANVNGSQVSFTAGFSNSSTMTVNAGFGAWPVVEDSLTGPIALNGGEIVTGNFVLLSWDSVNSRFHIVNNIFDSTNIARVTKLNEPSNLTLSVTASGGVLTVAIKTAAGADPSIADPVTIPFHAVSAYGSGGISYVSLTAAKSQTLSSGSTLGEPIINAAFRVWIVAFNNAGTVQIGLIMCTTYDSTLAPNQFVLIQYPLARDSSASTTAEGGTGTADASQTFYTSSALASKFYTVIGSATWENGLATLGTWTAPTRVQLFNANTALPGQIVQTINYWNGQPSTATTVIPYDNTIPQSTEGDEFSAITITGSSKANPVRIEAQALVSSGVAGSSTISMTAYTSAGNVKAATAVTSAAADSVNTLHLQYITLGSTSPTTWNINVGPSAAGTVTINGVASAGKFGGTGTSYILLQEIQS